SDECFRNATDATRGVFGISYHIQQLLSGFSIEAVYRRIVHGLNCNRSGVSHFERWIAERVVVLQVRRENIHDEKVVLTVLKHVGKTRIDETELLIVGVVSNLHEDHRSSLLPLMKAHV